jgi:hypothetical protein
MAQYKEDMDFACQGGCTNPGCTHDHAANEPLVIWPRCHPRKGVDMELNEMLVLRLTCHICHRFVTEICLQEHADIRQDCHPTEATEVWYTYKSGVIEFKCWKCDRVLGSSRVLSRAIFAH